MHVFTLVTAFGCYVSRIYCASWLCTMHVFNALSLFCVADGILSPSESDSTSLSEYYMFI
jgi:hypothetical protein